MTYDGLTETQRAFLSSRHLTEAVEDLSAADINRMSMTDYREIRHRAGLPDVDPFATAYAPAEPPRQAPAPAQQPAPEAPDVAAMDWAEYAAYREASGLAARSNEGMSHASLSMTDRWLRPTVAPSGRTRYYSGQ